MAIISKIDLKDQTSRQIAKLEYTLFSGLNILIGPNGSGKSTILDIISGRCKSLNFEKAITYIGENKIYHFDFEKDNTRIKQEPSDKISPMVSVLGKWVSHGQFNKKVIEALLTKDVEHSLILMDEPEQSLDIENLLFLKQVVNELLEAKQVDQIIISTHSPVLIFGNKKACLLETVDGYYDKVRKTIFNEVMKYSTVDVEDYYKD